MLNLLDESLEEFLRAVVPLPKREVDISFDAPDKDWSARVSRPTINVYLWDVRRNVSERELGLETVHDVEEHFEATARFAAQHLMPNAGEIRDRSVFVRQRHRRTPVHDLSPPHPAVA